MSRSLNTESNNDHISRIGVWMGPNAPFYFFAAPLMLAVLWTMGALFAPGPDRIGLVINAILAALAVFVAFPAIYFRGWIRVLMTTIAVASLALAFAGAVGIIHLAIFFA